jgi:predicted amidohydrolase
MKIRLTLAQINYDSSNVHGHIERIKAIISEYRASDLIVFPELILHGHPSLERPEGLLYRIMEGRERRLSEELARFVRDMDTRVILGEIRRKGDYFYNMATYMDDVSVQSYAKTHIHWTEHFIPGKELPVFSTPAGRLGMMICFDAAFPEVGRVLALRDAQIIVNIASVPMTFSPKYMQRRLAAIALNNQVFVVYVNRPAPNFAGHSAVFDPRGNLLTQADKDESVFHVDIDLEDIRRWREEEHIYGHRRPLLYRDIVLRKSKHTEKKKMPVLGKKTTKTLQRKSSRSSGGRNE